MVKNQVQTRENFVRSTFALRMKTSIEIGVRFDFLNKTTSSSKWLGLVCRWSHSSNFFQTGSLFDRDAQTIMHHRNCMRSVMNFVDW